jgi:hypothetical protein
MQLADHRVKMATPACPVIRGHPSSNNTILVAILLLTILGWGSGCCPMAGTFTRAAERGTDSIRRWRGWSVRTFRRVAE